MTPEQAKHALLQRGYNVNKVQRYIDWTVLLFRKSYFKSFDSVDELEGDYHAWLTYHAQAVGISKP